MFFWRPRYGYVRGRALGRDRPAVADHAIRTVQRHLRKLGLRRQPHHRELAARRRFPLHSEVRHSGSKPENPANYSYNGSTYNFFTGQTDPYFGGFPRIQITGFPSFQLGGPASWPKSVGPDSVYQFTDTKSPGRGATIRLSSAANFCSTAATTTLPATTRDRTQFASPCRNFFSGTLKKATVTAGEIPHASLSDNGLPYGFPAG